MTVRAIAVACVLAVAIREWDRPSVLTRLVRNVFMPIHPPAVPRAYDECPAAELVARVSTVVSVKDTCTQATMFLAHLSGVVPREMAVFYALPDFEGCNRVDVHVMRHTLPKLRVVVTPPTASPIAGFLAAQPLIRTPFALLLHNDAYAMDPWSVCELYRALASHRAAAFAVPQLYERAERGIVVPHAHHRNPHVRRARGTDDEVVAYDIDFDLLTRRAVADFVGTEGPQRDFMEDHAYMARTSEYGRYMDRHASFTMEYIDNVLMMRANGTYPWYVPSARFVFDVSVRHMGWRDVPYFSWKRSERVALRVIDYLTAKWGVPFPNSGIWNYVRQSMLHALVLGPNDLPESRDRRGHCAMFLAWFESIGFDSYDGRRLPDAIGKGCAPTMEVARRPHAAAPPPTRLFANASALLPHLAGRKAINVTSVHRRMPIAFATSDACDARACGMLVVDGGRCTCYANAYRTRTSYGAVERVMDAAKLPSRSFRYMRTPDLVDADTTVRCAAESPCAARVSFSAVAHVVRWAWAPDV